MPATGFGDFLRARRAQVTPDQVGLPTTGRRRVPGLRREEVAALASLSTDYYVRLEQGRERSPSTQVVGAIAAALKLDHDARQHLYRLVGFSPVLRAAEHSEQVDLGLRLLMDAWSDTPALVLGRAHDMLAYNPLGGALWSPFTGSNLVLNLFLDPRARSYYYDWKQAAVTTVASFRATTVAAPDDPRVCEVLAELIAASPEFVEIWERHDARGKSVERKTFVHPAVGELTLLTQLFDIRSAPGQQLVVYSADPGSMTAQALRLLGALAATHDAETARQQFGRQSA